MLSPRSDPLADELSSMAAAALWNVLDLIVKLPAPQAFDRIKLHIETAITAYAKGAERRVFPSPSEN